ncbi:MAG: hypothetical protein WC497_04355 [Patescibacteria group bacterium]
MKKKLFLSFLTILVVAIPFVVLAENTEGLTNPLGDITAVDQLIVRILKGFLGILSLFSLVMVIYGGFQYVSSAGNQQRVTQAKDTIVWALVGLVIAFLSLAVVNWVVDLFKGIGT